MKSTLASNSFIAVNLALMTVFMTPKLTWGQPKDSQVMKKETELLRKTSKLGEPKSPEQQLKIEQDNLVVARKNRDKGLESLTLLSISRIYSELDNPDLSLQYSFLSLSLARQIKNQQIEAANLMIIGAAYFKMSHYTEALQYYQAALSFSEKINLRELKDTLRSVSLNNIALIYQTSGKLEQAINTLKQVLPIIRSTGHKSAEGQVLGNIGIILSDIGKYQEAIEYLNLALKVSQTTGARKAEALTLSNLGAVYLEMNKQEVALDYFGQSLSVFKGIGNKSGEAIIYNNIGKLYLDKEQSQKALNYFNLAISIYPNNPSIQFNATVINNIGSAFHIQKKYDEAIQQYEKSLKLSIKINDREGEIKTLNNIASLYSETKQAEKSLDYFQRALPLSQQMGAANTEATISSGIGFNYKHQNRLPEAIQWWEKSLAQMIALRRDLKRENRAAFTEEAGYKGTATVLIDALIDTRQEKRAYEWSNLVNIAELADYSRLLNAKVANPKAQTAIDLWNQSNSELQAIRQQLQGNYSPTIAKQMREKEAQVNQQAEAITAQYPEIAELFETKLSDIAKLQANLPVGTTVLHPVRLDGFSNIPRNLALFVITRNSLSVKKVAVQKKEIDQLISETYGRITNRRSSTYRQNLATLYNLLIKPIKSEIISLKTKQLSIIATGQLRYIPFESLYDSENSQYLIEKYPINYLTRLSLNSFDKSPISLSNGNHKILALGNPVTREPLNLPGALAEVNAIAPLFPGSQPITGQKATLSEFKVQSPRFSILHLATHGCFQSGGCPHLGLKENTILFADRQFNIADAALLGLKNTELVTLTACQSALNSLKVDDRGQLAFEGGTELSGLAYLLERAGAKAVIPTLWSVEDESTQAISVSFYSNLKQGMNKSEALRQAKLQHIDKHPFFWAPLILIGDPR